MFCGIEWGQGTFSFIPLWIVAAVGNIVGSSGAYAIGRYLRYPAISKIGSKIGLTDARFRKAEQVFTKRRIPIVLLGKFISGIRVLTPPVAGMNRMGWVSFTLYNAISAFIWAAVFLVEGYNGYDTDTRGGLSKRTVV